MSNKSKLAFVAAAALLAGCALMTFLHAGGHGTLFLPHTFHGSPWAAGAGHGVHWMMVLAPITMFLFFAVAVTGFVLLIRWLTARK